MVARARKSLLISLAFLWLPASGCGGQSTAREGEEENGGSSNGGSANEGTGGPSTGTGGSSIGTGGSPVGKGGSPGKGGSTGKGGSPGKGGTTGTGGFAGSGAGGPLVCTDTLVANRANNYAFDSTLSFPIINVQPDTELTFRWSEVTTDFLGHSFDPLFGIETMHVMLWDLTPEELQAKLRADTLAQRDLTVIATVYTQKMLTEATLFDVTSVGVPVTPEMILPYFNAASYPPAEHTYTLVIASSQELGKGMRMIQAFKLDPASTNTLVEMTNASSRLSYTVDLLSLVPTAIPAGSVNITIDWTNLTVDARGDAFVPNYITEVVVARFDESVSDLEAQFLDLELIAEQMWRFAVPSGTSLQLSSLTNEAGQSFTGIDGNGTWLVALICGSCGNPAPKYMAVLVPCPVRH